MFTGTALVVDGDIMQAVTMVRVAASVSAIALRYSLMIIPFKIQHIP
jgi:hypothetical protein